MKPQVEAFYDALTGTVSYVVFDAPGGHAAIIDPVLDFDVKSGRSSTRQAERIIGFVRAQALQLDWIIETHAHADHLSAAQYLKQQLGGQIAIGEHIHRVQTVFKALFNLEPAFAVDGSQFDRLFADGEEFAIGALSARALWVPGHTPADMAYLIGDALFVGDTLFMPDLGTARCDFPGGDAHALFRSIRSLLALPLTTRMFMCHDYPPAGRSAAWQSSVAAQRLHNIHVHDGVTEAQFVAMREARDATLEVPELILPAVQVNIRAGAWPPADDNGVAYLRLPLNVL
ncbi:MBL fold metallo-hydrolase [Uliginosibacterium sediminicola]|uniref:MBL fold metallo-hydrolase n=1 Tax=Uliginosibacterium sediminicola TaxID=2024550 RepID=A0ABU9Z242_9RHOO